MPETKTDTTTSHDAVKTQIDSTNALTKALGDAVALKTKELQTELDKRLLEVDALKKQNIDLNNVIENDLKADLKMRIMAKSNLTQSDLEKKTVTELQQIDSILSVGKGADATYKNIRAGNATASDSRMTVGSLFGKTKEQILAMGGDF